MTEAKYQNKIIKEFEEKGYFVLKLIKTNKNGIPDLLALKNGDIHFIEVKGNQGVLSPLQEYRIKELKKYGFKAEARYAP